MSDRWRITYDDHHQEDEYDERPSEFLIRQTQNACPDTPVRVWRLIDGWKAELVEERPALEPAAGSSGASRASAALGHHPAPLRLAEEPCGLCGGEGALRDVEGKLAEDCPRCSQLVPENEGDDGHVA